MFREIKSNGWSDEDDESALRAEEKEVLCDGNSHLFGVEVESGADSNNKGTMNQSHN